MISLNAATGTRLGTADDLDGIMAGNTPRLAVGSERRNGWIAILRDVPRWMVRGYQRVNATDLASAVAFQAMVAVLPMFLLLISVAGLFLRDSSVLQQAILTIAWILPPGASEEAFTFAFEARSNSGLFGALSLLGFAWVGTGFVSSMARSMNRIYGAPNAGYLKEKQRGFIVILLFALFFVIASSASIITTFFVNAESDLPPFLRRWVLASGRGQLLAYGIGLLAAFLLFLTIYRLVPNAGQMMMDVWPGAVISSLLFVLVTQFFPLYLRVTGGSNRFGVALGLVTLMVATFYVLAHVILFGCYVNATWQRHRRERARTKKRRRVEIEPGAGFTPRDPHAARTEVMDPTLR